ncbi:hypothetical protein [Herbaspirillum huttiense]|uniref:Integrase catalytic domain-containing protein n=1 Tax=Herbaspirillum huttiense subsp. nephrolepidis TaxID=3075126 RepID=A0AAE4GCX4_9BURK
MTNVKTLIPISLQDLSLWPKPDLNSLPEHIRSLYLRRKLAIEGYARDESYKAIEEKTELNQKEVRRLIRRCTAFSESIGQIWGFFALIPNARISSYERRSPIDGIYRGRGAYAGAFEKLLEKYPDVREKIDSEFLKKGGGKQIFEARVTLRNLHDQFKSTLKEKGLTEDDYPFNTNDVAYRSLCSYCRSLSHRGGKVAMRARAGMDAANRDPVGNGKERLIRCLRPYSSVQLDYLKVDAASIIMIKNSHDEWLEVLVARWYIGLLVEEDSGAIIGAHAAFEMNPSGDTALEVVDSCLRSKPFDSDDCRSEYVDEGKALVVQMMPELEYQTFSSLKVDRGWANSATDVVNNIMDTFGCSICFGPTYSWWKRDLIERINGQLTRRGLQRFPSTYGSSPHDTKKDKPGETAKKLKIKITDLVAVVYGAIREMNEARKDNLEHSSPITVLRSALKNPKRGFFHQPIPRKMQEGLQLLAAVDERIVAGNIEKNVKPYFSSGGWRYTNITLANSWHLVGKKIIIYTNRRLCRNVLAYVKDTGEPLGPMQPIGWPRDSVMTLAERKMMARAGVRERGKDIPHDSLNRHVAEKINRIQREKKGAAEALKIAKHLTDKKRAKKEEAFSNDPVIHEESIGSQEEPKAEYCEVQEPSGAGNGVFDTSQMRPIRRKR